MKHVIGKSAGILVLLLFLGGRLEAQTVPASESKIFGTLLHSALLQVDRSPGSDDAVWQREIGTQVALARSSQIIQQLLQSEVVRKGKLRAGVQESLDSFSSTLWVAVVPGTSLVEMHVMCADDPAVNAQIATVWAQMTAQFVAGQAEAKQSMLRQTLEGRIKQLQDELNAKAQELTDFAARTGVDFPEPVNLSPNGHAQWVAQHGADARRAQLKAADLEGTRQILAQLKSKLEAAREPSVAPVHFVQAAV